MGLDFNLFGWVGDRFNDLGNGARRAWQGLNLAGLVIGLMI